MMTTFIQRVLAMESSMRRLPSSTGALLAQTVMTTMSRQRVTRTRSSMQRSR